MLIVLFAALAAAASMRASLDDQYYNQLAREAAESGVVMTRVCYAETKSSASSSQWPNAGTLRPNTDCLGANVSSQSEYVMRESGSVQTRFEVSTVQSDVGVVYFEIRGIAERIRETGQVVSQANLGTYTQGLKYRVRLEQTGIVSGKRTVCSIVAYRLYCWGRNDANQIPGQPAGTITRPVEVQIGGQSSNYYVQSVAAGWAHACAITSSTPEIDYSQGNQTQVWCWGQNYNGQLGESNTSTVWTTPRQISNLVALDYGTRNFTSISARDHTCVSGREVGGTSVRMYCWGLNNRGQAGDQYNGAVDNPRRNAGSAIKVSSGSFPNGITQITSISPVASCFVNSRTPYCLGSGVMLGQPGGTVGESARGLRVGGNASSNPLTNETAQISIDWNHGCALTRANDIYCWGSNAEAVSPFEYDGRLDPGIPSSGNNQIDTPVKITPNSSRPQKFVAVSTAARSTCAVAVDQKVYCWGNNREGELGIGQVGVVSGVTDSNGRVAAANMMQVKGALESRDVKEITSGGNMYCVITTEEETYCWGEGQFGQLGNGSTDNQPLPVQVEYVPSLVY